MKSSGDPNLEFATVLESGDPLVIGSAKGLLEEAGIPFYVLGEELGMGYGTVGSLILPWCRIQVAIDREQEARALLAMIEQNPHAPL